MWQTHILSRPVIQQSKYGDKENTSDETDMNESKDNRNLLLLLFIMFKWLTGNRREKSPANMN